MKISSNLTSIETQSLLQEFYQYFERESASETGRAFEEFLREYFIMMGLDEVVVTQRSRDGGIDLTAMRKGVGDFSESDITKYYIQAKRNSPSSSIGAPKIQQLKGTIPFGHKGIFVTTAKFSDPATIEASNDPSKPVVLIDGKQLVLSCIDNEVGFVYKPIFSKREMDLFAKKTPVAISNAVNTALPLNADYVEKTISTNDIRRRILLVPKIIMNQIAVETTAVTIKVNNVETFQCNIDKERRYFGSVTDLMKKYGLLIEDGVANPKTSKWLYDSANNEVNIFIEV